MIGLYAAGAEHTNRILTTTEASVHCTFICTTLRESAQFLLKASNKI